MKLIGNNWDIILDQEYHKAYFRKIVDFVNKAKDWEWTEENLHEKLADFRAYWKEKDGIKPKVTMQAVRAAITGRTCGADMVGILEILGKETSLYRASKAIKVAV